MNQDIYAFAKYYFNIFRNPKASNFQVEEGFAEKCFSLGFEMDCGKSFTKKYPDAFRTAEELVAKKSKNAMKVSHVEERFQKKNNRFGYEDYVERYTDKRIFLRLVRKHAIKPCGKECWDKGALIANQFNNHQSFKNFPDLMNDEDFILSIAKTSINPAECEIYFYDYVNPYLKAKDDFKLKFLKAVYLNKNVYKLEDINTIVKYCGFEKENNCGNKFLFGVDRRSYWRICLFKS